MKTNLVFFVSIQSCISFALKIELLLLVKLKLRSVLELHVGIVYTFVMLSQCIYIQLLHGKTKIIDKCTQPRL